uniref:D-aminoacyl-tRNA deacylase n=1 Tax=Romanomermis culicivorax TaxID=13658 RepID=A0A915JB70_ROMCU
VDSRIVSSIGRGLCVLIGLTTQDAENDIDFIIRKLLNLRIFQDPANGKKWDKSVLDLNLEILCISQFTLCATLKGNKPDYHLAMEPEKAKEFYEQFLTALKERYRADLIQDGLFGAYMQVSIENDGPVTINIDSRSKSNGD